MKHLILIIAAICSVCATGTAQVGFGPEVGLGFSTFKFAPMTTPIDYTSASASAIFSGKVGALADIPLNKHFYFQAGADIALKGGNKKFSYYHNDSFNESVNQTLDIYYAELPINVIFKTGDQGQGRFTFGIGAVPSYIIGGRNHLTDAGYYNDTSIASVSTAKIVIGETVHGFDIGVNLTVGYELPTGLFFRLYYISGVNDIGIQSEVDKNRMFGLAAGYLFGKGRNINKEADDLIDKGN